MSTIFSLRGRSPLELTGRRPYTKHNSYIHLTSTMFPSSESSGFVSANNSNDRLEISNNCCEIQRSVSSNLTETSDAPSNLLELPEDGRASNRRYSSSQKLAKLLNALTPCRGKTARRSHSFGELSKTVRVADSRRDNKCNPRVLVSYILCWYIFCITKICPFL